MTQKNHCTLALLTAKSLIRPSLFKVFKGASPTISCILAIVFSIYNCYYENTGSEVKNITDEIPFDIPDSWCWVRINNYVERVTDFVASGSFATLRENVKYYKENNYALLVKTQDFANSFTKNLTYTDQHGYEFLSNSNLFGGELILSNVGSIGKVFIVPTLNRPATLAPNAIMVRCVYNACVAWLFYLFKSNFGLNILLSIASATAIKKFNKTDFKTLLIPIPSIAEQVRIVAEIEKFEPLIVEYDKLEQQATKLDGEIYDKLKKSILQHAIQGKLVPQDSNDESASVLLERIRAEKKAQLGKKYVESYIYKGDDNCYYEHINGKDVDITEEIPYDLPNGWEWTKLKNIVFNIADIDHKMPSTVENGIPYISPLNFIKDNKIDFVNAKKISVNDYIDLSKKCKPIKGDIIFPRYGTIGIIRTIDVDIDFLVSYSCATIKPNQTWAITEILYYFLNSPWIQVNQINKYINKTTQPNIGLNSIKEFLIPLPPLAEQKRIVEKIGEIFAKL